MRNGLKRVTAIILVSLTLFRPTQVKADIFGGDVAVLVQILANALQQLQQLRSILQTGSDNLALIREINQGINDSLKLIRTISPYTDPGIYSNWNQVQSARQGVGSIYGTVTPSQISTMQENTDQSVAEAITLNNAIYTYTRDIDQIGESIKTYSHSVSPGGAQKLTAEGIGIMLNVMNQSLRAQATGLKLQAQGMAVQNQKDKEYVRHLVDSSQKLNTALKAQDTRFELPRF